MTTQFERFHSMAALLARGVELAKAGYEFDHYATYNDTKTGKRPRVIAYKGEDYVYLGFNAFCDDSVDFYGKSASRQANECAEALCEQIAQRAVQTKRERKAARKAAWRKNPRAVAGDGFKTIKAMYREDSIFFVMGDYVACGWNYTRQSLCKERRLDHLARARELDKAAREHGFYLP